MIGVTVQSEREDDLGEKVKSGTQSALLDAVEAGFDVSQQAVPVDTGALKQSGRITIEADGTVGFEYTEDHAIPVEGGTDPHTIEGDPLAFVIDEDPSDVPGFDQARDASGRFASGTQIFAQTVEHPGTDAQPFIQPGFREMARILQQQGISPHIDAELE